MIVLPAPGLSARRKRGGCLGSIPSYTDDAPQSGQWRRTCGQVLGVVALPTLGLQGRLSGSPPGPVGLGGTLRPDSRAAS